MRILILSNKVPYPARDGSSIAIKSMTEGYLANGAQVELLSLNTRKHFRRESDYKDLLPKGLVFDKVDVNTDISTGGAIINLLSGKAYHVTRFKQSSFSKKLLARLKNEDYDIIQLEGLSMAVYLNMIRRNSQAKVVLRAHNIEFLIWQRHSAHESMWLKRLYLKLQAQRLKKFEKRTLKKVDACLFISSEDQRNFRSWGSTKDSMVAPCGLNPEEYPLLKGEEEFDLVHLASLDWLPNQQGAMWFLEKVWPLILEARPQTKMAFGGRNMTKDIIAMASDNLWLYPKVEEADTFINKGKLAIIPLLAGSGMRIKLLEYLAWGKAVLSTSIGAEGISVRNEEEILISDNAEGFAAGVVYLLDNTEARASMEKAARSFFEERFNNEKIGKEILQFLAHLK